MNIHSAGVLSAGARTGEARAGPGACGHRDGCRARAAQGGRPGSPLTRALLYPEPTHRTPATNFPPRCSFLFLFFPFLSPRLLRQALCVIWDPATRWHLGAVRPPRCFPLGFELPDGLQIALSLCLGDLCPFFFVSPPTGLCRGNFM